MTQDEKHAKFQELAKRAVAPDFTGTEAADVCAELIELTQGEETVLALLRAIHHEGEELRKRELWLDYRRALPFVTRLNPPGIEIEKFFCISHNREFFRSYKSKLVSQNVPRTPQLELARDARQLCGYRPETLCFLLLPSFWLTKIFKDPYFHAMIDQGARYIEIQDSLL